LGWGIQKIRKNIWKNKLNNTNDILKPLNYFSRGLLENSFINCAIENTEDRSEK
jgi:hypothetical protein